MQKVSDNPLTSLQDRVSHVVAPDSASTNSRGDEAMTNEQTAPTTNLEAAIEWSLAHEVVYTRERVIKRARWLAEKLTRLADGLESDPAHIFNGIGELQGNGVELDTWCTKLDFARDTLKTLRQAMAADAAKKEAK
jgi:hypothetical protein